MEISRIRVANSQPIPNDAQEAANIYKDETNLIDYFKVLRKRNCFILLGSILPALVVGLITFLWPRDYKMTYVYETGLTGKD